MPFPEGTPAPIQEFYHVAATPSIQRQIEMNPAEQEGG